MDEKNPSVENSSDALDLSALSSLNLEPSWASDKKTEKISIERSSGGDRRRGGKPVRRGTPNFSRERKGEFSRPQARGEANSAGTPSAKRDDFRHARKSNERFHGKKHHGGNARVLPPRVVDVAFFPEEKPFAVLSEAIKKSARTYELFEIANLILEKPERFVIAIKPLSEEKPADKNKGAEPTTANPAAHPFFISAPDGMPFLSETDALAYVFDNFSEKYFSVETVEIEPPKGNFTMIAKCGFTGELLAPPNYHGYQQILRDFHAANFPKMPFEKFLSRVETVKDSAAVETWIGKMKTVVRYTVKDRKDGEPETLDGVGAAKAFLATNRKAVRTTPTVRLPGKFLERMPISPIKTAIENELALQRRFPLTTANSLRGRLRHSGFSLFKRGQKGVTFVCSVHRKFRTPDSVFSDTVQRVFDFLEKNPKTKIQDLPKKMFGLDDVPAAPVPAENAEVPASENSVPAENVPADSNASEPAAAASVNSEIDAQISSLLGTVRWLVLEGYVSELSDGSLFTYPKMNAVKKAEPSEVSSEPETEPESEELVAEEETVAPEQPAFPEPKPETEASEEGKTSADE